MWLTARAQRPFTVRANSGTVFDVAVAVGMLVASLVLLSHGGIDDFRPGSRDLDLVGVALAAGSTMPLVAWRRFPLGVFALTAAVGVVLAALDYPLNLMLGPAAALYLMAASRDSQHPWTPLTAVTVAALLVAYLSAATAAQGRFSAIELFHTPLAWAVAWFAGERTRLRREQLAELEERAEQAEQAAERERLLAVAEERTRIARDLHDSAGHAISVIAVRAGAARLGYQQDPERSRRVLEAIEDLARETLEEIDAFVGTLREGDSACGTINAPLGLASLDSLVAHHAEAGLDVRVGASGTPRPLAPAADQGAYRILQEALTNATRHGAGSARIELAYGDAALELTVTNPVPTDGAPRVGGGHGLIGMRERATLLGGRVEAERANGVFRVRARIPYGGHRA